MWGGSNDDEQLKRNFNYIRKNSLKVQIKMAQCVEKAFVTKVMSIVAYDKEENNKRSFEITFINKDMRGVYSPHNNALVLTININFI